MDTSHLLREIQQISLIQKKIDSLVRQGPKAEHVPHVLDSLDTTSDFTARIVDGISSNTVKITDDLLTAINHELRTPLVPIRTYADMLLRGDFGALNEEQQARLSLLVSNAKQLQQKIESLLSRDAIRESMPADAEHKVREVEQEKALLERINALLDERIKDDSLKISELKKGLKNSEFQRKEIEQKNKLLSKSVEIEEQKSFRLARKNMVIIAVAALVIGSALVINSLYITELAGYKYQVAGLENINTGGYLVQNLRGDTIDTWLSWRLVSGSAMSVGVINGAEFPELMPLIREVVESEEAIEIDDSLLHKGPKGSTSTYYVGWQGALKQAAMQSTEFHIPTTLRVIESPRGEGEITIVLTDDRDGDGHAGFTKSIADDSQNQILKSTITIYDVSSLGDEQFKAILRHEMGHALGLAHSTAPEDLMAPTITTLYPYISECDISSIVRLYDGGRNSQVVCEK